MKHLIVAAVLLTALSSQAWAHSAGLNWGISISGGRPAPAPSYYYPAPPPVYYAPVPPAYYYPAPRGVYVYDHKAYRKQWKHWHKHNRGYGYRGW